MKSGETVQYHENKPLQHSSWNYPGKLYPPSPRKTTSYNILRASIMVMIFLPSALMLLERGSSYWSTGQ